MNYKILLLLLLSTNMCSGYIYSKCDFYNDLDTCIDNTLCQWCNITDKINITNTGICKPNTICLYNNTNCVSNNKLNNVCNVLDIFISLSLIFMLFGSIIYISYFSSNIINKYFYIPDDDLEGIRTRKKEKAIILTIINVLLFIPPIVLWILGSMIFLYYTIFLMLLIVLLTCTSTGNYIKKKKIKSGYVTIQ